jgi:nucleotide-binding universal stress UspA family protein
MTAPSWMSGPPKKILLATDLSSRCDRALDRAAALAEQWDSALVVLHVLERSDAGTLEAGQLPSWRRPPDPVSLARKQLHADIGVVAGKATVLIDEGNPVEAILRSAEAERCDLIIIGIARDKLLARLILARTADRLLRCAPIPLLIVKNRPRRPYRHIVVAADCSDSSRHALEVASRLFPAERLTVFHAYDAPTPALMTDSESYSRQHREVAVRGFEDFLAKVDKPANWETPHVLIEDGSPTFLLRDYVRERDVELVVLGTHARSAILEVLVGSVANAIMNEVPCDVLAIQEPSRAQ